MQGWLAKKTIVVHAMPAASTAASKETPKKITEPVTAEAKRRNISTELLVADEVLT